MIPINMKLDDYCIKNIDSSDMTKVLACVNEDQESFLFLGRRCQFTIEDIEQRYLETLVSTLDFFCGIYFEKELIGIFKGRIENKSSRELWVLSYILLKNYRNNGIGSALLKELEKYFSYNLSIDNIFVLTTESNFKGQKFWINNNYKKERIIKNMMDDVSTDMIILGKELL